MKKIIMLALVLTTIASTAFSNNTNAVNQKVLSSFSKAFNNAEDVQWEITKDLYRATFKSGGQIMYAYYNHDGTEVALTRNIFINQLPLNLSAELKKGFAQNWLTELFEVAANGETAYYATIENATHVTILKADGTNGWVVFKKDKKKD